MTRKEYETITAAFRDASRCFEESRFMMISESEAKIRQSTLAYAANRLADRLAADNSRFDRWKFIEACALKG